jgi:hypothetical protein
MIHYGILSKRKKARRSLCVEPKELRTSMSRFSGAKVAGRVAQDLSRSQGGQIGFNGFMGFCPFLALRSESKDNRNVPFEAPFEALFLYAMELMEISERNLSKKHFLTKVGEARARHDQLIKNWMENSGPKIA